MKIKAEAATLNEFSHNDTRFAFVHDQLMEMAATAKGVPITDNFDQDKIVGVVEKADVIDGKLIITGKINSAAEYKDKYLAPAYRVPDYKSITYGITKQPCDTSIGFINTLKEDA